MHNGVDPDVHKFESVNPESFPNDPLEIIKPVDGEIDQINLGLVLQLLELPLFSNAPVEVLVIHIGTFVHSLVGKVKSATGGVETYMGTTPTAEVPQGF